MEFNGALYSYVHDLQGDVVGIIDSAGRLVVEYKYDVWGKPILVRTLTTAYNMLAELNPFRYRGYIWDSSTALYYLRSRYFSPAIQRFINEDCLILTRRGFTGSNIYAYCANNPVINIDGSGCSFMDFIKGAVSDALHWGNEMLLSLGIDTARIGAAILDMTKDENGVYHARVPRHILRRPNALDIDSPAEYQRLPKEGERDAGTETPMTWSVRAGGTAFATR